MKKIIKKMGIVLLILIFMWAILTFWAESTGKSKIWQPDNAISGKKALIVYDPDPFYNLDEQVCRAFSEGLNTSGIQATVATVAAVSAMKSQSFDLYIFCANTYNWRPDWSVSRFIKKHSFLKAKPVVAITLGAGSTIASQKALEKIIIKKEARLLDSRSFWLMKPNDETRANESNITVAVSVVNVWAKEIAKQVNVEQ